MSAKLTLATTHWSPCSVCFEVADVRARACVRACVHVRTCVHASVRVCDLCRLWSNLCVNCRISLHGSYASSRTWQTRATEALAPRPDKGPSNLSRFLLPDAPVTVTYPVVPAPMSPTRRPRSLPASDTDPARSGSST